MPGYIDEEGKEVWSSSLKVVDGTLDYDGPKPGVTKTPLSGVVRTSPERGKPVAIERQSNKPALDSKTPQELKYILEDLLLTRAAMVDSRVAYVVVDNYGTVNRSNIRARIRDVERKIAQRRDDEDITTVVTGLRARENDNWFEFESSNDKEGSNVNETLDAEFYRRQAAMHLATAEKLDGMPMVDPFEDDQVIFFKKTFGAQTYKYVAIKTEVGWFLSGNYNTNTIFSWTTLLDFISITNFDTIKVLSPQADLKEWWASKQKAKEIEADATE
jgi:hypothetical protein